MAKIKLSYDTKDDIPAGYEDLYTEKDDKWVLTGVEGIKSQDDVARVQAALTKERADHKETKDKLKKFGDLDPTKVQEQQDELEELRVQVETMDNGKPDEAKIDRLVEQRVQRKVAPLERENAKLKADLAERDGMVEVLTTEKRKAKIEQEARAAAKALKVVGSAEEDVVMLAHGVLEVTEDGQVVTKDGVGVTPGVQASAWLEDLRDKRPHWWPASQGGGGEGGNGGDRGGSNPWSAAAWSLTEQGRVYREQGAQKAEQMAKQAGVKLGATGPAKKA